MIGQSAHVCFGSKHSPVPGASDWSDFSDATPCRGTALHPPDWPRAGYEGGVVYTSHPFTVGPHRVRKEPREPAEGARSERRGGLGGGAGRGGAGGSHCRGSQAGPSRLLPQGRSERRRVTASSCAEKGGGARPGEATLAARVASARGRAARSRAGG